MVYIGLYWVMGYMGYIGIYWVMGYMGYIGINWDIPHLGAWFILGLPHSPMTSEFDQFSICWVTMPSKRASPNDPGIRWAILGTKPLGTVEI